MRSKAWHILRLAGKERGDLPTVLTVHVCIMINVSMDTARRCLATFAMTISAMDLDSSFLVGTATWS